MSINATVIGNVTRDAETKAAGNSNVVKWSIAVNRKRSGQESVTFVNCSWFGASAEKVTQYIAKGKQIAAHGSLYTRENAGKTYVELDVRDVDLLGGGGRGQASAPSSTTAGGGFTEADYGDKGVDDDPLPF